MNKLWENNTANDRVTSVMVPLGYTLKLYEHGLYDNGRTKEIEGALDDFGYLKCQSVWDFNDITTSAALRKNESPYARGEWISMGSG